MLRHLAIGLLLFAAVSTSTASEPFADIHTHFNWDQKEIIDAADVVRKLRAQNIAFTVAASTPTAMVQELRQAGGDLIVPFFSPYTHPFGKKDWFLTQAVVEQAEAGLKSGLYQGIGEVHFMSGFLPRTTNEIFLQLLQLASRYDVPVLIHIDSGNEQAMVNVCSNTPEVRFIFAHAGGNLRAEHVRRVIEQCDNVMIELSARDPWRYGRLTGEDGKLLPDWRNLVVDHPHRFVTGTDPVWRVTRSQSWDESDEGWDHFEELLSFHRHWIDDLPPEIQPLVRLENAKRLLRRD